MSMRRLGNRIRFIDYDRGDEPGSVGRFDVRYGCGEGSGCRDGREFSDYGGHGWLLIEGCGLSTGI